MDSQKMLELKKWAVVGVTPDPNRFGYKIFKKLKREGYDVYPVNPRYSEIEGCRVYPDLEGLPEIPDVVNLVVKPEVGIEITKKLLKLNVKNLWLQPGTVSKEILDFSEKNGINTVRSCVLVELDEI